MTLCLNLPIISSIWNLHRGPGGLPRTNRSWSYPGKSGCAPRSSSCPPGSAGCSPQPQSSGRDGQSTAQLLPGSATRQLQLHGRLQPPALHSSTAAWAGWSPGTSSCSHFEPFPHAEKRPRKLGQIWLGHYFGKRKATPATCGLKSCSGILQEWPLWLLSGGQAGPRHSLPDAVAYSKYPCRKQIYQEQTVPRLYE